MIRIEFKTWNGSDPGRMSPEVFDVATREWPDVPRVGEHVMIKELRGTHFTVVRRVRWMEQDVDAAGHPTDVPFVEVYVAASEG